MRKETNVHNKLYYIQTVYHSYLTKTYVITETILTTKKWAAVCEKVL